MFLNPNPIHRSEFRGAEYMIKSDTVHIDTAGTNSVGADKVRVGAVGANAFGTSAFGTNSAGTRKKPVSELKHFIWNAVGVASNTLTSLVLLMAVVRISGVDDGGVFSIAFTTSLILVTVGLYGIRNYQVTDLSGMFPTGVYVSSRFITSAAMLIIGILFCVISGYSIEKAALVCILVLYKMAEAISDVLYGVLQKNNMLYIVGISMTVRGVLSISSFIFALLISHNLLFSCLLLMIAGYIPFILIDIPYSRKMEPIAPIFSKERIISLFKVCFPVFAVAFLSLIVVNIPKYVIDRSLTNDSQAIYNIIVMPGTSIALFSQVIIQSFLLKLAQFRQNAQMNRFSSLIGKIVAMIVLFSGLFGLFCYFWGNALLYLLYGIDLNQYIPLLLIVVAGSMFSSITGVLSAALVALRVTKIQLYLYLASLLSALVISPLIIPTYGLFGAAIAYFAIMFIQFLLYAFTYIGNYYREKRAGLLAAQSDMQSMSPDAGQESPDAGEKESQKESV